MQAHNGWKAELAKFSDLGGIQTPHVLASLLQVLYCLTPRGGVGVVIWKLESFLNSFVKGAPEQFYSIKSGFGLNYSLDLDATSAKNSLLLRKAGLGVGGGS